MVGYCVQCYPMWGLESQHLGLVGDSKAIRPLVPHKCFAGVLNWSANDS